jgi:hypothetical protein
LLKIVFSPVISLGKILLPVDLAIFSVQSQHVGMHPVINRVRPVRLHFEHIHDAGILNPFRLREYQNDC